jgi:hypothetical protein
VVRLLFSLAEAEPSWVMLRAVSYRDAEKNGGGAYPLATAYQKRKLHTLASAAAIATLSLSL